MNGQTPLYPTSSRISRQVWMVFLGAVLLRLIYLAGMRAPFLRFDESWYWLLATSLLRDGSLTVGGTPVTDFEPLYPLFLAVTRWFSGNSVLAVQIVQVITASVGAVYLYRLANALTGQGRIAVIAASLYALDPLLIRQAAAPAESALVTTLLIAFAYYFVAGTTTAQMASAGFVLGLAIVTRTMIVPLAVFAAALLIAQRRSRAALALAATVCVLLLPLCIRNWSVNGSLWPTRSGLNLFIGNSPYTAALVPDYDLDILQKQAALVEGVPAGESSPEFSHAADARLARHAFDYMKEHPLQSLRQKAVNALYFFSPRLVPYYVAGPDTRAVIDPSGRIVVEHPVRRPRIEHLLYSAFYAPVLVAALAGIYIRRRDWRHDAILWGIAITFVAIYALYFPATRYRAPMEFVLLFHAATALQGPIARTAASLAPIDPRIALLRNHELREGVDGPPRNRR